MKTLVYYSSLTGNTRRVGKAIAQSLNADIKSIDETVNLDLYENIIFGFYVDKGFMVKKAQQCAEKIKNKKVGIFFTLGAEPGSNHAKDCMEKSINFFSKNNEVIAHFCCQGKIDPQIIKQLKDMAKNNKNDAIHRITPQREARWKEAEKHPDETDILNAVRAFNKFNVKTTS